VEREDFLEKNLGGILSRIMEKKNSTVVITNKKTL
jgi:hypothetical protein